MDQGPAWRVREAVGRWPGATSWPWRTGTRRCWTWTPGSGTGTADSGACGGNQPDASRVVPPVELAPRPVGSGTGGGTRETPGSCPGAVDAGDVAGAERRRPGGVAPVCSMKRWSTVTTQIVELELRFLETPAYQGLRIRNPKIERALLASLGRPNIS